MKQKIKKPLIIAHRGASGDAPENTHAAISLAWKQGADGIEVDVRLTKDREVVVIHDLTTERTQKKKEEVLNVEKSTWEQLKTIDVGNQKYPDQSIPLLRDVLQKLPKNKMILIEIKGGRWIILDYLMQIIKKSHVHPSRIRLMSFSLHIAQKLKEKNPKLQVFWLPGKQVGQNIEREDMVKSKRNRFALGAKQIINFARKANLDGVGMDGGKNIADLNYKLIHLAKRLGMEIDVWTVNDVVRAKALASLEVDMVTTNFPKKIKEILF